MQITRTVEFNEAAGIDTVYIPFTGSGDVLHFRGHVTGLMTYTTMAANYRSMRPQLARRAFILIPDVPTFKELATTL